MFLFEGDQLRHETVIRGVKYVTVSHYSGERDIFEVIGDLITDSFCSSEIHKLTKESSVDLDIEIPKHPGTQSCSDSAASFG